MGLNWTGERLTTDLDSAFGTFEHLHRYAFSREVCRGKKVLDIASGEGYGSKLIAEFADHVWGVDISSETVIHAKEKYVSPNLQFIEGSATSIPLEDSSVDVVISFETIEHIINQKLFLSEVKRVLKSDGIFIASSPDKAIYSERDPGNPYHVNELTTDQFRGLVGNYFRFTGLFQQRMFIGSVISNHQKNPGTFNFYDGSFSSIQEEFQQHDFFNKPFFNLIVASDSADADTLVAQISLFSAYRSYEKERNELLDRLQRSDQKLNEIEHSATYRLLELLRKYPLFSKFRFLKRFVKF
jgi:SAM-dependent methyltransferase